MPLTTIHTTMEDAISDLTNARSIMIGGDTANSIPSELISSLKKLQLKKVSLITSAPSVISELADAKLISDVLTSVPEEDKNSCPAYGTLPIKTLSEKALSEAIRAGGSGLGGVYLPINTLSDVSTHVGKTTTFVEPVKADVAIIRALKSDTLGNLVYSDSQKTWSPLMATAGLITIAEVDEIVATGELSPEHIVTPCIYVDRIVLRSEKSSNSQSPRNAIFSNTLSESKIYSCGLSAMYDIKDGSTILIDGFAGPGGMAQYLLVSLRDHGAKDLTMVSNSAGIARVTSFGAKDGFLAIDHSILFDNNQISKVVASFPVSPSPSRPNSFELAYQEGKVQLELVAQGTLAERIRSGGNGVLSFYTPTGVSTVVAKNKETRLLGNRLQVLEHAIRGDFAIIRAHKADTLGNLVYKGTSRNFNAVMAPAADITIAEVDEIVEAGQLDPASIVTSGKHVHRIVKRPNNFSPYERIQ